MQHYTKAQLFIILTTATGWNDGFCSDSYARQIKSRHNKGTLSDESYDEIFFHFGYKKHTTYSK